MKKTNERRLLIAALLSGLIAVTGCASAPAQPNPPPTPPVVTPTTYAVRLTVRTPDRVGAGGALVTLKPDNGPATCANTGGRVTCETQVAGKANLTITQDGYLGVALAITVEESSELGEFHLVPDVVPLPPAPTLTQLLTAQLTFQGLTLRCADYPNGVPVFDVMYDVLSPECRADFRAMKHAAGDKVIAIAVSHAYLEPGIRAPIGTGHDWSYDYPGLGTLISEIVHDGLLVQLHMAGDGSSSSKMADGSWRYNDPVGWTYGQPWLMENVERIINATIFTNGNEDLHRYVRFIIGFDGVFYGWTPEQVVEFGERFKQLCADCALGIEHDGGHIPLGEGGSDYLPGGRMQNYNFVAGEYDPDLNQDTTYQILGRMVPNYQRPPEQSPDDDPRPPFYLRVWPGVYNCFEWNLYDWVRDRVTAATLEVGRARLRTMGCRVVG